MKVNLKVPMSDEPLVAWDEVIKYVPEVGNPLGMKDLELAFELVRRRMEKFPSEPANVALATVMINMGHNYTPVACREGEWTGIREDLIGVSPPACPNGHEILSQPPLQLVWAQHKPNDWEVDEVPVD